MLEYTWGIASRFMPVAGNLKMQGTILLHCHNPLDGKSNTYEIQLSDNQIIEINSMIGDLNNG